MLLFKDLTCIIKEWEKKENFLFFNKVLFNQPINLFPTMISNLFQSHTFKADDSENSLWGKYLILSDNPKCQRRKPLMISIDVLTFLPPPKQAHANHLAPLGSLLNCQSPLTFALIQTTSDTIWSKSWQFWLCGKRINFLKQAFSSIQTMFSILYKTSISFPDAITFSKQRTCEISRQVNSKAFPTYKESAAVDFENI